MARYDKWMDDERDVDVDFMNNYDLVMEMEVHIDEEEVNKYEEEMA